MQIYIQHLKDGSEIRTKVLQLLT